MLTPRDREGISKKDYRFAARRLKASAFRFRGALDRKYDPNQPRHPAGSPDGGRWSGGSGGSGGTHAGASGRTPSAIGKPGRTVERDKTGNEPWAAVATTRRRDGSVSRQTVFNRDGGAIRSEFGASGNGGRSERHTVISPGGDALTFESDGLTQRILDRDGNLLSDNLWTPQGPEAQAIVQPAFAPALPPTVTTTIELGLTLGAWLSSRNSANEQAVLAFRAFDYAPTGLDGLELGFVGMLQRDEVDKACPRHPEVRSRTDRAYAAVRRAGGEARGPAVFGTLVHSHLKRQIDRLYNPRFRAEVSALKTLDETYGKKNSIRIDVFEDVGNGTYCVYDIKTGKSGLTTRRANEIASKVYRASPFTKRIIVIETKLNKK